jgi:plasmid stability protein
MVPLWSHSGFAVAQMPNLSIKNVPAEVVGKLRERATANHRSLQGELLALVTGAVSASHGQAVDFEGRRLRHGHKSIEQIAAEHLQRFRRPVTQGGRSVDLIRGDRDAR